MFSNTVILTTRTIRAVLFRVFSSIKSTYFPFTQLSLLSYQLTVPPLSLPRDWFRIRCFAVANEQGSPFRIRQQKQLVPIKHQHEIERACHQHRQVMQRLIAGLRLLMPDVIIKWYLWEQTERICYEIWKDRRKYVRGTRRRNWKIREGDAREKARKRSMEWRLFVAVRRRRRSSSIALVSWCVFLVFIQRLSNRIEFRW